MAKFESDFLKLWEKLRPSFDMQNMHKNLLHRFWPFPTLYDASLRLQSDFLDFGVKNFDVKNDLQNARNFFSPSEPFHHMHKNLLFQMRPFPTLYDALLRLQSDFLDFRGMKIEEIWILTMFPASICPEKPSMARYGFWKLKISVSSHFQALKSLLWRDMENSTFWNLRIGILKNKDRPKL